MSNVQFTEEEKYDNEEEENNSGSVSGFASFLIKKGIVKNEKQANIAGLIAVLIFVIITLFLL